METFAKKHNLSHQELCALSMLIERAADAGQMSHATLATAACDNDDLGERLASVARKCARETFRDARIHSAGGLVAVSRCSSNRNESLTDIIARRERESSR